MKKIVVAAVFGALLCGHAYADKSLELWTFIDPAGDNPRSKAVAQIIQTFEAQNPGVKIKPTIFAWNQIGLAFMKAGLAGKVPDVTMLNSGRVQRVVAANFLQPLDSRLEKSGEPHRLARARASGLSRFDEPSRRASASERDGARSRSSWPWCRSAPRWASSHSRAASTRRC